MIPATELYSKNKNQVVRVNAKSKYCGTSITDTLGPQFFACNSENILGPVGTKILFPY